MESFLLKHVLHKLPEEIAHQLAILALKYGVFINSPKFESSLLKMELFGKTFANPIGLAAGFDKNAECIDALCTKGFGFIECGTVTLRAQYGNAKPRMFRLKEDKAIINRMGFNNKGIDSFIANVQSIKSDAILGINIGVNKDSKNIIDDYVTLAKKVKTLCDYIVLNISSPNTPGLRNLSNVDLLSELLDKVTQALMDEGNKKTALVLKISPDMTEENIYDVAKLALDYKLDAMIVSNTTVSRTETLLDKNSRELGGLSGKPIFDLSTQLLKTMYCLTKKQIPMIASGGINDAITAYNKIKNGASLLQLYTAIVFEGFELINKVKKDMVDLLQQDGFANLKEAVGKACL